MVFCFSSQTNMISIAQHGQTNTPHVFLFLLSIHWRKVNTRCCVWLAHTHGEDRPMGSGHPQRDCMSQRKGRHCLLLPRLPNHHNSRFASTCTQTISLLAATQPCLPMWLPHSSLMSLHLSLPLPSALPLPPLNDQHKGQRIAWKTTTHQLLTITLRGISSYMLFVKEEPRQQLKSL